MTVTMRSLATAGGLGVWLAATATAFAASGTPPDGGGFTAPPVHVADEMTADQRRTLHRDADTNVARLRAERRLAPPTFEGQPPTVLLEWPLRPVPEYRDPGFYAISNYVDQDPTFDQNPNIGDPATILDYMCGARTYDTTTGYGHSGTDIFLFPFAWNMMDAGVVQVVAAAPGIIINKDDGHYDRNCSFAGTPANFVMIGHDDGSRALYFHLRNGSVTAKTVGDPVALGEYLGTVGSSGDSTGPHLHFEVADSGGALNDPWQGPCNELNATSWWKAQPRYREPSVVRVSTGTAAAVFSPCSVAEIPSERQVFHAGDTIFFNAFFRDLVVGDTHVQTIRRPDGSVFFSGPTVNTFGDFDAVYFQSFYDRFAPDGPTGRWQAEIALGSQTVAAEFELVDGPLPNPTLTPTPRLIPTVTPFAVQCGDADLNGSVTVSDAVNVLRAAAGLSTTCVPPLCDVDDNGAVSVTDGVNVLRAAAGLSATLVCSF